MRVRVCAVVLGDGGICLIRRERPAGVQYSLPGGLAEDGEPPLAALHRELGEELGLDTAAVDGPPVLRWVQEQTSTRPGRDGVFRRRHLVFVLHLPPGARGTLATAELDAPDAAPIVWPDPASAAGLHLYPAVGAVLARIGDTPPPTGPALLPPMTDATYSWR
ncbi:NUDIX hydrolase [Kitasatospora sp. NPDC059571]|uniref:NUDIX hydrolase n=1 Tax=Kitasatospora sp. NPDC059571 TaxID=3346871 RepID=UPI0036C7CACF